MAVLTDLGTKLLKLNTGGQYEQLTKVTSTPDTGAAAEKIDITSLDDEYKKYTAGRKDIPDYKFEYLFDPAAYAAVKAYVSQTEAKDFMILYGDGKTATHFQATGNTWKGGISANQAGKCTLTLFVSEMDDVEDATSMLAANPNPALGTLTVVSAEGTTSGNTHLTVTPAPTDGNIYKYETAASVTLPAYDADVSALTSWNGTSDITATTGNQIMVIEATSGDKAVKGGIATVTSKA